MASVFSGKPWKYLVSIIGFTLLAASCAPAAQPAPAAPAPAAQPPSAAPTRAPAAPPVAAPTAAPASPRSAATPTPAAAAPAPKPVTTAPKKGGTFTFGSYIRMADHDPHTAASVLLTWDLAANGLLDLNNNTQEPLPDLAEKWEVSKDGTIYTFHLYKGVKFQNVPPVNGREMTADDVVYSFNRIRSDNPRFARRTLFEDVKSIKALDKYTVQFTLASPSGPFLTYVANQYNKVVAKEVVDKFGDLQPKLSAIGTGPYLLKTARDPFFFEMTRNTDYFQKDRPKLDTVRMQVIEDDITRAAALRTGQIDVAVRIPPSAYQTVKSNTSLTWDTEAVPWATQLIFQVNRKPWNDVRVRRAVHLAINRDEVVQGAHEGAAEISGPLAPVVFRWAALQPDELRKLPGYRQPKDQDIAEAKKLLAEAGYPNGFEMTMPVSNWAAFVNLQPPEVVKGNLAKVGIKVNFKTLEQAAYIAAERDGDFEIMTRAIFTSVEPDAQLGSIYSKTGSRNPVGLSDPQIEALLVKGRGTLDREERKKIYRDIQMIILDKAYRVYMDEPFTYTGKLKYVKNYDGQWILDNRQVIDVWLDK